MEMTHLSQITGDPKYYDAIARVMDVFYKGQNETLNPGMWPMFVSMAARDVVSGSAFTIGGCADSLYEYLPKMHALLGGLEPKYQEMSRAFMRAADRRSSSGPCCPPATISSFPETRRYRPKGSPAPILKVSISLASSAASSRLPDACLSSRMTSTSARSCARLHLRLQVHADGDDAGALQYGSVQIANQVPMGRQCVGRGAPEATRVEAHLPLGFTTAKRSPVAFSGPRPSRAFLCSTA